MNTIYVNGEVLVNQCNPLMDGHVKYQLGAKSWDLERDPAKITALDCSGFFQYILYHACNVKIRAGSWYQNQWMKEQGFSTVDYATVGSRKDNILRAGYFKAKKKGGIGHIWLVLNGETIESYSGGIKHGPGRRPWDTRGLKNNINACYELGPCKKVEYTEGFFPQCKVVTMDMSDAWE